MLKMKNKYNIQKVKKQNRNLNFILGVQSSRSATSKRTTFVSTISCSSVKVRSTIQNMNNNSINNQPPTSLDSNEKLSNSSETQLQQNNNGDIVESIPVQASKVETWDTKISSVPQLVTAAQTRAVLIARKEEPNIEQQHTHQKSIGWTISASLPAIRRQMSTGAFSSQIPSNEVVDDDDDDMGETSKYFPKPSTPVSNPTFRTERTPIRSVLNSIQGPPSPSKEKNSSTQNKKSSTPYVLQSPWVSRFSNSQQRESSTPKVLMPGQTSRYSVKEMLDLMCPPDENDLSLDDNEENNVLLNNEMNSQNGIDDHLLIEQTPPQHTH